MISPSALAAAEAAFRAGQFDVVGMQCQGILAADPNNPQALKLMGIAAAKTGRLDLARRALSHCLQLRPHDAECMNWLGIVLQRLGDFGEARTWFERALDTDPGSYAPYVGIFRGARMTASDRPLIERAQSFLASGAGDPDHRRQLTYGIAKALDDLMDYEASARYFESANRLAASIQKPDGLNREIHLGRIRQMTLGITRERLQALGGLGSKDRKPIFIVGMIRSGTTLVEQVLSSHPDVAAGDELRFWIENGPAVIERETGAFDPERALHLQAAYLGLLDRIGNGLPRVTDKMPLNYMVLGLVHLLFPEAPIIHCRRAPADTCVSIYMTPFAAPPDFAYDRGDIEFAYREYVKLMRHWTEILPPGRILDVDYEDLVSAPEPVIRRILDYCSLEWDDRCLRPEENARAVDTPSRWQVRQAIYGSSVSRSSHYPQWFPGLSRL